MRLWHIDLIPYLPKSQLLAQWRELNSIFKKQDKHILINYIYDYPKNYLKNYAIQVKDEMYRRGYNINSFYNYNEFFNHDKPMGTGSNCFIVAIGNERFKEHNNKYLTICYYNLKEKYIRGQKDFTKDVWKKLDNFYKKEITKNGKEN